MRYAEGHRRGGLLLMGATLALILALAACNYRFGGYREGQAGIDSVNIPPFENRTRQIGIESFFTNDLVYEVGRGDRISVVGPDRADAVVQGVIRELVADTVSRQNLNVSLERRVYVTIELFVKTRQGKQVWYYKLRDNEVYFVEGDKVSTEANLRDALAAISRRIAEKFHYRFTQAF